MRKRITIWLTTVMVAVGMMFATTAPAQAGVYTKAFNECHSSHRILVASGLGGSGTRSYVNPCRHSPGSVGSIYVHYTKATSDWTTRIGGTVYTTRGWKNVGHHWNTKYVAVSPWIIRN